MPRTMEKSLVKIASWRLYKQFDKNVGFKFGEPRGVGHLSKVLCYAAVFDKKKQELAGQDTGCFW